MKALLSLLVWCHSLCVAHSVVFSRQPPRTVDVEIGKNITLDWRFAPEDDLLLMKLEYSNTSSFERSPYRIAHRLRGSSVVIDGPFKDHVHVSPSGALTLWNIGVTDEGYYRCHIEVLTGKPISSKTHLLVGAPPVIEPFASSTVALLQGNDFRIYCRGFGHPSPTVTWRVNKPEEKIVGINNSLQIKNVSLSDAGQYNCCAINRMGMASRILIVQVYERPRVSSFSHTASLDGTIYECEEIVFTCEAFGNDPPVTAFYLYHNDQLIQQGSTTGKFRIKQVRKQDEGRYSCVPENEHGLGIKSSVDIKVRAAPNYCKKMVRPTVPLRTNEGIYENETTLSSISSNKSQAPLNEISSSGKHSGCPFPSISLATMLLWLLVFSHNLYL